MRLIDADDLLERMKFFKDSGGYTNWKLLAFEMVDASPTVDTERHGHWDSRQLVYDCSECGHMGYSDMNYCPNCGAKMDDVEE